MGSNPRDGAGRSADPNPAPTSRPEGTGSMDPQGPLECALMDEYLADRGYTLQSVYRLPPGECTELLRRAATYATQRLAEIEARAHYVDDLEP